MIQLIDTHSHLYDPAFADDIDNVIDHAKQCGVNTIILPAIDSTTHDAQHSLCNKYQQIFKQMIGVHPTSIKDNYTHELATVGSKLAADHHKYIAIGEIGLDYYWDTTYSSQQCLALEQQLHWANQYHKPVCLHIRNAYSEMFKILNRYNVEAKGVFHCFSGTLDEAWRAVEMGYMIGIGGVVTFKQAALADIVKDIPLDMIVLETDSPYLAPTPFRGKRNESTYCKIVAEKIAEIKNITLQEVATTTTKNAKRLFRLE